MRRITDGAFCRVRDDAFSRVRDDAFSRIREDAFSRASGDAGGIVLGWLTRIIVVASLAALVLFDAISIGTTAMTVADQGSSAAQAASEVWQTSKDVQTIYNAAVAAAAQENSANVVATKDFKVDADGTVHLTVSRTATTLVVFRIGAIKKWAYVERRAEGRSVN